MFFGGKPKPEAVELSALDQFLNSLFDKKLAGLDSKSSRTVKEFASAKSRFGEACQKFEEVAAEPQLEYFFIDNVNFIKGQKLAYSKALRRIIADWDTSESSASTIHGKYSAILSNAERFVGEVLKANTNFKKVLQAYPGHLDMFKGSFSLIERLTESLRNELGRAAPALSEYRTISGNLSRLHSLKEEAEAIGRDMLQINEAAKQNPESPESFDGQRISEAISAKQSTLSEISRESSVLHQRIMHLTAPLERPSKKYDHIEQKKKGLNLFIKDPIGSLNSESDYGILMSLINEMADKFESGGIETKDADKVRESVAELANADIYGMVGEYRLLQQKALAIHNEIKSLESSHARFREAMSNSKRASESKESMRRRAAEIGAKLETAKAEVECMFLAYYGKRISIVIGQ